MTFPGSIGRNRWALLIVTASLLASGAWAVVKPFVPPYGGLSGGLSDHLSHMNAARLFTVCGTCLWQRPVNELLRPYDEGEKSQLPEDLRQLNDRNAQLFAAPGAPLDKPIFLNWPSLPRPYPPGALLLALPVTLVYRYTPLSFSGASTLLVLLYLFYAHLGLYVVLRWLFSTNAQPNALGLIAGFILYAECLRWALSGIYDVALLAPLALCGQYLYQRRGLAALVAYCVAAFIHYRAFLFAPLSLYAVYLLIQQGRREGWRPGSWAAMASVALLGFISLETFGLVAPWLPQFPATNPLRFADPEPMLSLVIIGSLAAVVLVYARAWMDLALLAWIGATLPRIYQMQMWHVLSLLIWLTLPVISSRSDRAPRVRDARLVFIWVIAVVLYRQVLLPPRLIHYL